MPNNLTSPVEAGNPTVSQSIVAFTVDLMRGVVVVVINDLDAEGNVNASNSYEAPLKDEQDALLFPLDLYDQTKSTLYALAQEKGWLIAGTIT